MTRPLVTLMKSPFRIDYTYVAGTGRSLFLRGLAQRRILARRCPGCEQVYVPPPQFCSRCLTELGEPFGLDGAGVIQTFCVVSFPFPGQAFDPPYLVAYIQPYGADTRLMHLVRDIEPGDVRIGMAVEPVWGDLDTSMTAIRYYRPAPDA
jgi:uncharacterized OB-fold protein